MSSTTAADKPLLDKTVLLLCSSLKFEAIGSALLMMGARVLPLQVITVRPIDKPAELDSALSSIDLYHWIVFTSSHAVLFFVRRMRELQMSLDRLGGLEVCAVGPATARTAEECGIRVSLVPDEFVAEGVLKSLASRLGDLRNLKGQRILLPRAREAREILPSELTSAGAAVDVAVCYETVQAEVDEVQVRAIRMHPPDLMVFTSSSNVTNFVAIVGESDAARLIRGATIAVLGPITARTLEANGKTPEILPAENTIPGLLEAIRIHFGKKTETADERG